MVLLNNELRLPFVNDLLIAFPVGTLRFKAIRGALFFDIGNAWEDGLHEMYGSFGFGFRVALGGLAVLRFDFANTTDFKTVGDGYKFDFFFGWNY